MITTRTFISVAISLLVSSAGCTADPPQTDEQPTESNSTDTVLTAETREKVESYRQEGRGDDSIRVIVSVRHNSSDAEYNDTIQRVAEVGQITAKFPEQREFGATTPANEIEPIAELNPVSKIRLDTLNEAD